MTEPLGAGAGAGAVEAERQQQTGDSDGGCCSRAVYLESDGRGLCYITRSTYCPGVDDLFRDAPAADATSCRALLYW